MNRFSIVCIFLYWVLKIYLCTRDARDLYQGSMNQGLVTVTSLYQKESNETKSKVDVVFSKNAGTGL